MAKGNMFQGMARGSVGDVVFYRMDGKQISRVRNRNPKNPKSQGQIAQRAIMATIMQAYSHGKEIFDHSFEGKPVGMGSMREFLSRNANALRQAVIDDYNIKPTAHLSAIVNAPKTNYPVPNTYVVSAGSLQQNFFNITEASASNANAVVTTPAAQEGETMAEYAARVGLHVGDIYTFVGFAVRPTANAFITPNGVGGGANQKQGMFYYVRLIVTDAIESNSPATDVNMVDIFEEVATQGIDTLAGFTNPVAGYEMNLGQVAHFAEEEWVAVAAGIIRSEVNSGLRSNETLHWCNWSNVYGIDYANLWLAWSKTKDELGQSDLILEGGGYTANELNPQEYQGLGYENDYLVAIKSDGTKVVLTDTGVGVSVTNGKIRVTVVSKTDDKISIDNNIEYYGELQTVPMKISKRNNGTALGTDLVSEIVITIDGATFATKQNRYQEVSSEKYDIPVSDFKIVF